jgi:hypothetical protein
MACTETSALRNAEVENTRIRLCVKEIQNSTSRQRKISMSNVSSICSLIKKQVTIPTVNSSDVTEGRTFQNTIYRRILQFAYTLVFTPLK